MHIDITFLHLEAQKLSLAQTYKIRLNWVFGRVLANDLGADGRLGCLSCLHQGLDLRGLQPYLQWGDGN